MSKASETKESTEKKFEQHLVDPIVLGNIMVDVFQRTQPILKEFMEKHEFEPVSEQSFDPLNVKDAYMNFMNQFLSDPQRVIELQMKYWQNWLTLCQESAIRFMGGEAPELYKPDAGDRRFKDAAWEESALFDFIKQSYLMTSQWMEDAVDNTEGLDDETRKKIEFYTKSFTNALAPSNFLLTNPQVLDETVKTGGENLVKGFQNLLEDIERGGGELRISTTDYDAFEIGRNLATTPGKVIYQNDLIQLIQYEPQTEKVHQKPLLIVPPWINKYYILDLQAHNSFIKWVVEQGFTVFVISWVNPDRELAQKRFEDYMEEGVFESLRQIETVTGEKDCNILGYCLGGTLTSVTLAWLAEKKMADKIISATFLTTLVDFEQAGDIKLFMDKASLDLLNKEMQKRGFLDADYMRNTFSLIRSNDMIWSFVVNNYLMGKEPFPFDLLYWNEDATNMPAAMHSFYMRKCYQDNLLPLKGGVEMNGVPIDMTKVKTPCYFLSTKEDHIAPWKATYATTQLFSGEKTFTLAASGHVAGVVNPPAKNKYCYWTNKSTPKNPDDWQDNAKQHEGSWWPHWQKWLSAKSGDQIKARDIGGGKIKPIEDAPGAYVKMKAPE